MEQDVSAEVKKKEVTPDRDRLPPV